MTHLELFAGIGGFRRATELLDKDGIMPFKSVGFSEIDKHALLTYKTVYNISNDEIEMGDIVEFTKNKENIKNLPNFDLLTGGFPCFVKGTPVLTSNGFKPIEKVEIGEKVLTHSQEFHSVNGTMRHQANEIVYVRAHGMWENMKVTPNHKFYARKRMKSKGKSYFLPPKYIPINQLQKGDKIGYPVINGNDLSYTIAFWKLIGTWLADGWLNESKRKGRRNPYNHKIIICCGKHNLDRLTKVIKDANYHYTLAEEKTTYKCIITDQWLCNFLHDFGKYAHGKHLSPQCFQLDNERKKALIEGWLADGYVDSRGNMKIASASIELVMGMAQIARDAYHLPTSIVKCTPNRTCIIEGRKVNEHPQYRLTICKHSRDAFYENGFVWCNLRSLVHKKEENVVYNLSVNNDPSYTVYGIAVHNCQSFSTMGKQQGFDDDLGRGQMFFRIMDILEVKHPPYVLLENVRNLLSHDNDNTFKVIKEQLESIGYSVHYDVFNTMDFHLPQRRRRVLIFATLDKTPFDFNSKTIQEWFDKAYTTTSLEHGETVLEFLDKDVDQKYFLSEKGKRYILSDGTKSFTNLKNTINTPIAKTLLTGCGAQKKAFSANYYTQEWIETNGLTNAQETMSFEELVKQPIRRLTPEEAYLLQGFPRDFALAARSVGNSNTALYKQAGNAISVNVIYAALRWLIENQHME